MISFKILSSVYNSTTCGPFDEIDADFSVLVSVFLFCQIPNLGDKYNLKKNK